MGAAQQPQAQIAANNGHGMRVKLAGVFAGALT
jgi:hypothetical protein